MKLSYNDKLPSISILILTYNCAQNLNKCLQKIRNQNYPENKIEILIMDGGSDDDTCIVAKNLGAKVVVSDAAYRNNAEIRRYMGVKSAKNEIIAGIDSDNFLPYNNWLLEMVKPLVEDDSIIGTYTLRYTYLKDESLLNRYYALMGVNDPVAFYLNKADRISWAQNVSDLRVSFLEERDTYYKVRFDYQKLPSVGANGFLIRRNILEKVANDPYCFFHIDIAYDLAKMGLNTYGIVKNSIIHVHGDSIYNVLKKRLKYMKIFHQQYYNNRRYLIYDKSKMDDNINLLKFIIYSVTFIKPFYDSLKGNLKIRDSAWFLNPLMCFAFLMVYAYGTIMNTKRNLYG